jgi:tryptophan 7-halogenase
MKTKILVCGGGTAGTIVSTYLKSHWGDRVDVALVYDKKNPGIGVGESTTPVILDYLNKVNIKFTDLIKNANSTLKLGINFNNWLGDNSYYYHGFAEIGPSQFPDAYEITNETFAQEVLENQKFQDVLYDDYYLDNNLIPIEAQGKYALHIDSLGFSQYVQKVFSDRIQIIDGIIDEVCTSSNKIDKVILTDGRELIFDLYIDATGISKTLIKNLSTNWVCKKDYIPINRAVTTHIPNEYGEIPLYTLAEASLDGWIWSIPLSHRYGSGYLYSTEHTSDDIAISRYSQWLLKNYSHKTDEFKVIDFSSGYLENQWIGNCISVGLSSGFVEPLESTSIHTAIFQAEHISELYPLRILDYNIKNYNQTMRNIFIEIIDFVRLHYHGKRNDSKFWKYISESTPSWINDLEEKVKVDFYSGYDLTNTSFCFQTKSYTSVLRGLNLLSKESAEFYLRSRNLNVSSEEKYNKIKQLKTKNRKNLLNHRKYVEMLRD